MGNQREQVVGQGTTRGRPSNGPEPLPAQEFSMPFQAGQLINGKYEIVELIGVGGIGFVVAALHVELGEKVALKFLRPEALANHEAVGRFAREARASAQIRSEHVVRVFDVGHLPDGAPFIVMEYLDGKDLDAVVREQGALPIKLVVDYVLQTCEALASAHASGIVHRDVKPENLFLSYRAQGMDIIKVLDFGISKVALTGSAFESRHPLARTTMAMGSPIYMSPEQIRASQDIDVRTDIWSLGCVLYELLTGTPAFDAPSITQVSAMILEKEPPSLLLGCPSAPTGLDAIVQRCLSKDPIMRFQNVAELAIALYPFGPQRGRISVERCCTLLRSAGLSQMEFKLSSVFPSSFSESPGIPSSRALGASTLERARSVGPTPSSRLLKAALAAAAIAAVVYGASSFREAAVAPLEEAPSQTVAAASPAPAPTPALVEVAKAPVPSPPEPVRAAPAPANIAAPVAVAAAAPRPSVPAPAPAKRRVSPPPPKPKPAVSNTRPAPTVAGEPDVGF
jgi:serine/threonine protein kinase